MRITAGSTSVRAFEQPLRDAGAMARAMLIAAAAGRWDVEAAECDTADGFVVHRGKTLPFGQLAEEAAGLRAPANPQRRTAGRARLIGKPLPRLDLPAKSNGSFRFAGDVRLPDMLFAAARVAPPGGRLTGFSRPGAEGAPRRRPQCWLAVVADNLWAAERALKMANPHFEGSESPPREGVRALSKTRWKSAIGRAGSAAAIMIRRSRARAR